MTAYASNRFLSGQARWESGQLNSLRVLRDPLKARHKAITEKAGYQVANTQLRIAVDKLRNRGVQFVRGITFDYGLSMDASDDEIREFAERKAAQCERLIAGGDELFPALTIAGILERCRIDSAWMVERRGKKPVHWEARVSDAMWWRRKMRVVCARAAEAVCRDAGMVHRRAGCYVSDFGYRRWLAAQSRNAGILAEMEAINDNGEVFSIEELSKLSTSNPELRRGELMTRLRGFEEWAEQDSRDWQAVFYTLTCPSRFHKYSGLKENKNYDGSSPRAAQEYLCDVWAGLRSALGRRGLSWFGFRVAEPHHDGCPHWHLLLFVERKALKLVNVLFREYALGVRRARWSFAGRLGRYVKSGGYCLLSAAGGERGAGKHRFEVEIIDPAKGSAVGYISKYISKNIDGHEVGMDWESWQGAGDSALRVRAWASIWGIRQFQQIGGPPVTVWRELRRAANNPERVHETEQLSMVLEPADSGDWCGFTEAMGGAVAPRADRPAKTLYTENNEKTGEEKRGRYGDAVRRVLGVIGADFLVISRFREWVIGRKNTVQDAVVQVGRRVLFCKKSLEKIRLSAWQFGPGIGSARGAFELLRAGFSPPWTCVNNCTEVGENGS